VSGKPLTVVEATWIAHLASLVAEASNPGIADDPSVDGVVADTWTQVTEAARQERVDRVRKILEGCAPEEMMPGPPWKDLSPQAQDGYLTFFNVATALLVSSGHLDSGEAVLFSHEGMKELETEESPNTLPPDFAKKVAAGGKAKAPSPLLTTFVSSLGKGLGLGLADFLGKMPPIPNPVSADEPSPAPVGTVAVPVRVNGHTRTFLDLLPTATEEEVLLALAASDVIKDLRTRMIETKFAYVPGTIVEIAMRPVL